MLSSANRLYRNGCTSARVSGPPRFSSSTPTLSVGRSPASASCQFLPVSLASLDGAMLIACNRCTPSIRCRSDVACCGKPLAEEQHRSACGRLVCCAAGCGLLRQQGQREQGKTTPPSMPSKRHNTACKAIAASPEANAAFHLHKVTCTSLYHHTRKQADRPPEPLWYVQQGL